MDATNKPVPQQQQQQQQSHLHEADADYNGKLPFTWVTAHD